MMARAVVIKTIGDTDIANAIAGGIVIPIRRETPTDKRAAAYKREHQRAKMAQFRAATLEQTKWWEYVLAAAFEAFWGIFRAFSSILRLTLKLPGKVGKFFRRLYRWLLSDSHIPWAGLIGIAVCYGLFGVAVCKLVLWLRWLWG